VGIPSKSIPSMWRVALLTTAAAVLCTAAAALTATPNVLFIAVDDLRVEHGVYGGSAITPNIGPSHLWGYGGGGEAFVTALAPLRKCGVPEAPCRPARV
jgi:hypothetical protein